MPNAVQLRYALIAAIVTVVVGTVYLASRSTMGKPPEAAAAAAPDTFRVLGSWTLSGDETVRLVHVPDSPTGLRCLIYRNITTKQTVLQCDDDLPRNVKYPLPAE